MRASRMHILTMREDPADAEIASHRLLLRAGYMYKSGAGLYLYGPLLQRVLDKVRCLVAQEISAAGGLEITMPILQEQGLWERSGRWQAYQASRTMLTTRDRGGQTFGLAPTAEEVVTDYARAQISSWKQLPVCWFQQHTKFRDEIRPRFGLMRVKEFIMMDAYSFHADQACLDQTYQAMKQAYERIFRACGLEAYAVEADSGAIGGSSSHEFMVAAEVGEDVILFSEASGYAANVETACTRLPAAPAWQAPEQVIRVDTPGMSSIESVVDFLRQQGYADLQAAHLCKAVLLCAEGCSRRWRVAAMIRGDRQVNLTKLQNAISHALGPEAEALADLRPMSEEEIFAATQARPGFAGPGPGLDVDLLIVDAQLPLDQPLVCGANADDQHLIGLRWQRDVQAPYHCADILLAEDGDPDCQSGATLRQRRGIEVGHIFQLGTKYSQAMGAQFNGSDGQLHPLIMGCYGIGTSRLIAAAIEQHHDQAGIRWPMSIAPYHCVVVPAKGRDPACVEIAEGLAQELQAAGVECILDDRDCGPGVKFKDWELIGIPLTVVCGRGLSEGLVELKQRLDNSSSEIALGDLVASVVTLVQQGQSPGLAQD